MADWCRRRALRPGATLTLDQCWRLAQAWYAGRLSAGWRGRTAAQAQEVLADAGLAGRFWEMV